MAATRRERAIGGGRVVDEEEEIVVDGDQGSDDGGDEVVEVRRRVSRFAVQGDDGGKQAEVVRRGSRRVSRFAVEGGAGVVQQQEQERRRDGPEGGRTTTTLPPPHAWLAVEDTKKMSYENDDTVDQWARLLGGTPGSGAAAQVVQAEASYRRRNSFSAVQRERGTREAWLDRAWEMKKSWHERNGSARCRHPRRGRPGEGPLVAFVLGKGPSSPSSSSHTAAGVAMDMEEVRACRDLGLELPSDCTVEIQCYGLSAGSSPTDSHTGSSGSGADSPSAVNCPVTSPGTGEDPVDVKARLKVWAQAVALASSTRLGS